MAVDLVIYAVVAAGLVFWLKSVLGTRHGDERERPNPFTAQPDQSTDQQKEIQQKEGKGEKAFSFGFFEEEEIEERKPALPGNFNVENKTAENALADIERIDPSFELGSFADGAQDAFVLIVESFAKGHRDVLKDLLAENVYEAFDGAITQREKRGETVETQVHAVKAMDLIEVRTFGSTAYMTIRFKAEETCVIKDSEGIILSGDPERTTQMIDVWVFTKDLKSPHPAWYLHETRDDEAEDHKTPLPETA